MSENKVDVILLGADSQQGTDSLWPSDDPTLSHRLQQIQQGNASIKHRMEALQRMHEEATSPSPQLQTYEVINKIYLMPSSGVMNYLKLGIGPQYRILVLDPHFFPPTQPAPISEDEPPPYYLLTASQYQLDQIPQGAFPTKVQTFIDDLAHLPALDASKLRIIAWSVQNKEQVVEAGEKFRSHQQYAGISTENILFFIEKQIQRWLNVN